MKRIVILGNGFDLAHGLKTSYKDFIKYIIEESIENNELIIKQIIDFRDLDPDCRNYNYIYDNFHEIQELVNEYGEIKFKNNFFKELLNRYFESDWLDIEEFYFFHLKNTPPDFIERLQSDFEILKQHLQSYFIKQIKENDIDFNPEFLNLFTKGHPSSLVFLNFNYTSIIEIYFKKLIHIQGKQIINIHGKLNSEENPIVFGYGDDSNPDYQSLIKNNNNLYLRNLKKQQYNLADQYAQLNQIIDNGNAVEIYTIGHSLGLTDKTLLREIMERPNVNRIEMFYYKNREGFRNLNDNIVRIVDDRTFRKVVNFTESFKIPQIEKI